MCFGHFQISVCHFAAQMCRLCAVVFGSDELVDGLELCKLNYVICLALTSHVIPLNATIGSTIGRNMSTIFCRSLKKLIMPFISH